MADQTIVIAPTTAETESTDIEVAAGQVVSVCFYGDPRLNCSFRATVMRKLTVGGGTVLSPVTHEGATFVATEHNRDFVLSGPGTYVLLKNVTEYPVGAITYT